MSIRITALTHLALPFVGLLAIAGSCNSTGGELETGTGGDASGGRGTGGRGGNAGSGGSHSGGTSGPDDSGGQSGSGGAGRGGSGGAGQGGSAGAKAGGAGGGAAGSGGRTSGSGQGGAGKDGGNGGAKTTGDAGPVACDDIASPGRLAVYYYGNSKASDSSIQMHFDIVNYTAYTSRVQEVSVKYWFTDEDPSSANVLEQYYVPTTLAATFKFSTLNPPRSGADTVLEMSFRNAPDAGASWVETKGYNFAFHKASYAGSYDQSNDYSYDPKLTQALGKNAKITAYVNGTLAWGCEPPPEPVRLDAGTTPELDGGEEVDAPVVVRDARTATPDTRQGG